MLRKFRSILLLLIALVCLTGCSHKVISSAALSGPHPEQARFESVVHNQYAYESLQSKSRYSLGGTSLGGKLCLESGKRLCLQVNAPLLGFEVARVEASQDSVVVVDKYDKAYSVVRLSELYQLDELSGHEMEALECIMLGRIYIPGRGVATSRDYSRLAWTTQRNADGTSGLSQGVFTGRDYTLCYTIDATGRLVSTAMTLGGRQLQWNYAGYQEVQKGKWVPTQETITATDRDGQDISVGVSLSSPQLGQSMWRDFEPTASYRRVDIRELVDTVKSMIK